MANLSMATSLRPVYVIGAPGFVGGADTELWHTLQLWRRYGLELAIVPTWGMSADWQTRCKTLGCRVHTPRGPEELLDVPGLPGSTVVSFCNGEFLKQAGRLRQAGCRCVWANCMTWVFDAERAHFREHGPFEHFLFQSQHQRAMLERQFRPYGYQARQGSVIHGAFSFEEFPFAPLPHAPREVFVVGRISRPDPDKYSSNTWPIYQRIPHRIRGRVMAWSEQVEQKLGPPPAWAECLPANAEPAQRFLRTLHCLLQVNGGAAENWPRSGLEAMASGVPVVVQNQWGWREMLIHGQSGYLCDSDEELAYHTAALAYDEELRMQVVRRAYQRLTNELANPEILWAQWQQVFQQLELRRRTTGADKHDPPG